MDERLAIDGGQPACPEGPPPWPPADEAVAEALRAAAADGSWGRYHGPHGPRLAAALAEMFAVDHALVCCSGTFAVQLALRALGVGAGDEVILAGYDFPGNFRAIEAVGATPALVDVAPDSWNLDLEKLKNVAGGNIRAVIASHLHGGLVNMPALMTLAGERGWLVVEDACQVPGAVVCGRPAGSWGDVAALSFGGSKLLSAGRGGALLTQRADAAQRAKIFCEQGNHAFPLSELQAA
ncbi:MAG TPA: DegT/DnrJ/EryC1/StrS aminotransferase family protein, partial [Pirellulales bacterium]|nr:DegT/DnrJ/EryC1/StrS aminotransferase family protein [Pirellulales bacterium]